MPPFARHDMFPNKYELVPSCKFVMLINKCLEVMHKHKVVKIKRKQIKRKNLYMREIFLECVILLR